MEADVWIRRWMEGVVWVWSRYEYGHRTTGMGYNPEHGPLL